MEEIRPVSHITRAFVEFDRSQERTIGTVWVPAHFDRCDAGGSRLRKYERENDADDTHDHEER